MLEPRGDECPGGLAICYEGDVDSLEGSRRGGLRCPPRVVRSRWLTNYNVTQNISLLPETIRVCPGYTPPQASFVHGGITPEYAHLGTHHINTIGHSFLLKALSSPFPPTIMASIQHHPRRNRLWSQTGPLWYRGYASDPTPLACSHATNTTEAYECRHLVMVTHPTSTAL